MFSNVFKKLTMQSNIHWNPSFHKLINWLLHGASVTLDLKWSTNEVGPYNTRIFFVFFVFPTCNINIFKVYRIDQNTYVIVWGGKVKATGCGCSVSPTTPPQGSWEHTAFLWFLLSIRRGLLWWEFWCRWLLCYETWTTWQESIRLLGRVLSILPVLVHLSCLELLKAGDHPRNQDIIIGTRISP